MKILSLSFCILPALLFSQNQRWYVNSAATGQNTGANWPNAFTNLHDAFIVAQDGDEVWVAQGVYHPSETGNRALRFEPLSGVRLYGGFSGTETQLTDRPADGKSTIDGDIGTQGDSLDNSYNLMYLYHPDSTTIIDGFVFQHAVANQIAGTNGQPGLSGGALYIDGANSIAYPLIRNCAFEYNTAQRDGGAVYINGAGTGSVSPGFQHCSFRSNRSETGNGGAVYRNGGAWWDRDRDFDSCTFIANQAFRGGCIFLFENERTDTFTLWNCFFENSKGNTGNVLCVPKVKFMYTNSYRFLNCTFLDNGYQQVFINANVSKGNIDILLDACTFRNIFFNSNTNFEIIADGELKATTQKCTIQECAKINLVWGNTSPNYDPGNKNLFVKNNIINNKFVNISSSGDAFNSFLFNNIILNSNFRISTSQPVSLSNNIFYSSNINFNTFDSISIQNCTFSNDTTGTNPNNEDIIVSITNTIFDKIVDYKSLLIPPYRSSFFFENVDSITLSNCLFTDSINEKWVIYKDPSRYDSTTLFETNPLFRNPAAQDYRLSACSPAINAGNNAIVNSIGLLTDLNGDPRIQEGTVDIGAYEHTFTPGPSNLQVDAVCHNTGQGAINWTLGGGCAPIQYAWTDAQGNTGTRLDSLPAGEYRFTFTDARGRINQQTILIPASAPTVSISGDTLLCGAGSTGALTALPGGVLQTPITFMWNTGASGPGISGLSTGLYAVTLTDAVGCADTAQTNLNVVNAPQSSSTVTNATGVDSLNGRIDFAVTSGIGPFAYVWNTGDSTASISGLSPGFYTLVLFDGAGCNYGFVFEVGITVGTGTPGSAFTGVVRPNPAQDILYLDLSTPAPIASVQLTDALGRVVYASSQMTPSISVAHLPEGVYYLMIRQARGAVFSEKVVVRR